jgi:hypothetical protein
MYTVIELMGTLYANLYERYPEFKEANKMVDEIMLLPSEIVAKQTVKEITM